MGRAGRKYVYNFIIGDPTTYKEEIISKNIYHKKSIESAIHTVTT